MSNEPSRAVTHSPEAIREGYRLFHDTFKHLTTLSTGSILILAMFLDKLVRSPHWHILVPVSVLGFLVSVVASVPVLFTYAAFNFQDAHVRRVLEKWGGRAMFVAVGGFLVGVVALAVFAVVNL
jgi:hypothetical protein